MNIKNCENDKQVATYENGILVAEKPLNASDFEAIAEALGVNPGLAKKKADKATACMRIVQKQESVTTLNDDGTTQTISIAYRDDAIVTRLDPDGRPIYADQWVVKKDQIEKLYDLFTEDLAVDEKLGQKVIAKNEVLFISLQKGGSIEAPWGSVQTIKGPCVLQCSIGTGEVYLNEQGPFQQTYNVSIEESDSHNPNPHSP